MSVQIKISMDEGKPSVTGINKGDLYLSYVHDNVTVNYLGNDFYEFIPDNSEQGRIVTKATLGMYRDVITKMIGAENKAQLS